MAIIYPNGGGAVSGDFATKQSNSFNGNQTITGSLTVSGSNLSVTTNTRSQIKIADERFDLIVTGSRAGGTQILLDATNQTGPAQVYAQATNHVVMQAGSASANYPYYFHADADNKFVALEADDPTATIYVGGSGYASAINIGSAGSRIIAVGNTSSLTSVVIKSGDTGTAVTGSLIVSGTIHTITGGIKFPDGSTLTSSVGLGGGGGGGSGTVNTGNAGYITYYPSSGTTVDDTTTIYTDGTAVSIGTSSVNPSAILEIAAINKGLLFPRVSGSARATMTGTAGLIVYQTDTSGSDGEGLYIYKSTGWIQII